MQYDDDGYVAPDLSSVPSDVLLYELGKRYDVAVFAYCTAINQHEYEYHLELSGHGIACLGLLEWAAEKEKQRLVTASIPARRQNEEEE